MTAPNLSVVTSNTRRVESSSVVSTRFAESSNRSFVPTFFFSTSPSSSSSTGSSTFTASFNEDDDDLDPVGRCFGVYTAYAGGGVCATSVGPLGPRGTGV